MDIKVPKVPPDCNITFPTLFISSLPRRPYLKKKEYILVNHVLPQPHGSKSTICTLLPLNKGAISKRLILCIITVYVVYYKNVLSFIVYYANPPLVRYLRAVKPPNRAPVAMPTEKPIINPSLTRSQQLGP